VEKDAPFASNKTKNTITQIEILPLADSSHPHILLQLMKKLNSTLFAAALMLSPATTSAQSDTADNEKKGAKKADQEVVVEANDQMQFNKKAFEIKAGDTIKLTLKHVGKLPKIAMGHNLVILQKGTNLAGWASKAMTAAATNYIPVDEASKKAVIAKTKVLGGGETDSVTFSIKEAGEYQYLCSFPGHFALMQGKITVK
jgi:azurin